MSQVSYSIIIIFLFGSSSYSIEHINNEDNIFCDNIWDANDLF